jgi:O-antigen/teichoic acid export membrane protein
LKINSGSIKDLFGHSVIYGFGFLLRKALGFFLIPLYTHTFTQTEYGKLAMIYLFSSALTLFFSLGLNDALMKQLSEENANRKEIFSRYFFFRLFYVSLFLILLLVHSKWIASFLLLPDDGYLLSLAGLTIWIESLSEPALLVLRLENRSKKFVIINTLRFALNISLNMLLILYFRFGLGGVLLGNLGSSTILFFLIYPEIHRLFTLRFNLFKIKSSLQYGLPLLPISIIIWLGLDLIDRWIIKWILGLEQTGIYTLGYQFGNIMGIIVHGFRASWIPFFLKNPDKKETFVNSAITFVRLALIFWGVISFFTPEIFQILVAKRYWEAQSIVPIIALSYILLGLEEIFTAGFYIKSRTNLLIPITLTPFLMNVALNIYFIPRYGIIGAAFVTLFSFFTFALFSYSIGNKIFPVNHNIKALTADISLGIILLFLTNIAGNIFYQRFIAFAILSLVLFFKEKNRIKKLFSQIFQKY